MENKAFNFDAFDMIERLEGKVDVIYIDPPYPKTMNKYGDFYGIYDRMLGKSKKYIDFSKNNLFLENFEKLVKKCIRKTEYIVISENTKTEPSVLELEKMLLKYGTVTIKKKKHQYKVTNKKNKNITEEVLLILKVEKTYN
jgi:adenine-specific DNA-methyltransferase